MLTALSIRDVVLIERLDLGFGRGLTVLTGETGAGKSILLDSLGLALGGRAEAGLVRGAATQASVTACFAPPPSHPALALLAEQGLAAEDEIVLRRVVQKDGRSRAFVNDQPVGVALLRRAGALLVEVQGQHEQMGLVDAASHAGLLDAFGVVPALTAATFTAWRDWREATATLATARAAIAAAARDEEWLRHASDELAALAPEPEEEERLAEERRRLQGGEREVEAIAAALSELAPGGHSRDRRNAGPAAALRAAGRALQRLPAVGLSEMATQAADALERSETALAEAEGLLTRLARENRGRPAPAGTGRGTAVSACEPLPASTPSRSPNCPVCWPNCVAGSRRSTPAPPRSPRWTGRPCSRARTTSKRRWRSAQRAGAAGEKTRAGAGEGAATAAARESTVRGRGGRATRIRLGGRMAPMPCGS